MYERTVSAFDRVRITPLQYTWSKPILKKGASHLQEVTERTLVFIEDDTALLDRLTAYFAEKHNTVHAASTLADARRLLSEIKNIDAIILDVILPDGTGLDLLRETEVHPPVIILSDLDAEEDMLEGFDSGATDYVAKPCSPRLLEARIALRLMHKPETSVSMHGLTVSASDRTVCYGGQKLLLTASEFNVLYFLISNAGKYFTAQEIYEKVWGAPSMQTTTIRRHLSTLRQKLKSVVPDKTLIVTEFGKGYSFLGEDDA